MIKLFEIFDDDFLTYVNRSNPLIHDLLWKFKYFFDSIILVDHTVIVDTDTNNDELYLDINCCGEDVEDYVITVYFYNKPSFDTLKIFIDVDNVKKYPSLLNYIHMEISQVLDGIKIFDDDEIKIEFNKFSKNKLDKIVFSKDRYEDFKDAERFGL